MKVAGSPITLLTDGAEGEITMLTGGLRIVMSAAEASWLWAELGSSLRKIYVDHPERCPPEYRALLHGERIPGAEMATGALESVIDYARRTTPPPDGPGKPRADASLPAARPAAVPPSPPPPAGLLGRAFEKLKPR